jgi:hypothetical protein
MLQASRPPREISALRSRGWICSQVHRVPSYERIRQSAGTLHGPQLRSSSQPCRELTHWLRSGELQ